MALFRRNRRTPGGVEPAAGRRRSGRRAGAGVYGVLGFLASVVDIVTGIVAVIIALGIVFVVLGVNPGNAIVNDVHDAAKFLVGPFDGIFEPKDRKLAIAIDWGIALVVYVIVGRAIASLLRRWRA